VTHTFIMGAGASLKKKIDKRMSIDFRVVYNRRVQKNPYEVVEGERHLGLRLLLVPMWGKR